MEQPLSISQGNISALVTILMWSASALLLSMTGHIPTFQLGLMTLGFPIIFTMLTTSNKRKKIRSLKSKPLWYYLLGVLGIGGYTAFWYLGFKLAPPFQANIINYLWPFFILIFAAIFFKEKITISQIIGSGIAFLGLGILFYEETFLIEDFNVYTLWGYFSSLTAALIAAIYSILIKKTKGYDSDVVAVSCLLSCIPFLICHLIFEETVVPQGYEWIGVLGLILSKASYPLWNFAMKYGQTAIVVSMSYFTPLISSIFLILYHASPHVGLSALFILTGTFVLSWDEILKVIDIDHTLAKKYEYN